MKRILPHLILFSVIGAGAFSGLLSNLIFGLTDLSFRLASRPASGEIVIVAIDRKSLDSLGSWPWPRRHHAKALDRLKSAGAYQIALDIDFSGRTNAADDQALADAIGRANGKVVLPVFKQNAAASTGDERQVHTSPYAPFTLGARLGTVNLTLEKDGRARRYWSHDEWKGEVIPSLASLLANEQTPRIGSFFVDYGIQPHSIARLSYIDVLNGSFSGDALKGKTVIVGAMAPELGDQLHVPIHGVLSGPLVHALAFESLVQGRNAYTSAVVISLMVAFLLSFFAAKLLGKLSRRTEARTAFA